ncbi:MAG: hypothetical protein ACKVT0_21595 [Planctomycetaceae bacterium]
MTIKLKASFGPGMDGSPPMYAGEKHTLTPEQEHRMVRSGTADWVGQPPEVSAAYGRDLDAMFPVEVPNVPNAATIHASSPDDGEIDLEPDDVEPVTPTRPAKKKAKKSA